jgi:hypothetical protein
MAKIDHRTRRILCRCLTPVRDFLVFNDLPFIEPAEAGSLDCRNVYEHVLAAALRLDEAVRAFVRHSGEK